MVRRLGSSHAALKSPSSIARFTSTSLYVGSLRWLAQESWDDELKRAFFELYQTARPLVILAPPPFVHARGKVPPSILMRYLLVQEAAAKTPAIAPSAILATAEVHGELGVYRVVRILLSECRSPGGWQEHKEALAALISASCLVAEADVVTVVPFHENAAQQLAALELGGSHPVLAPCSELSSLCAMLKKRRRAGAVLAAAPETPRAEAEASAGACQTFSRLALVEIDPAMWWQTKLGAESRLSLSFLEKRMSRAKREMALKCPSARRRVPPLARLARLFLGRR